MSKRFTAEELSKLREIAKAATQGRWKAWQRPEEQGTNYWRIRTTRDEHDGDTLRGYCGEANARHIAEFNPPTVLALLDEIERLRQERRTFISMLRHAEWRGSPLAEVSFFCPWCGRHRSEGHQDRCGYALFVLHSEKGGDRA